MTDDTQQSSTASQDPPQPPAGKDPLAVLEELLAKQKASSSGGAGAGGGAGQAAAPDGPTPDQEKATQQEELKRLEAEAAAKDEALLQAHFHKFEEVKASPQYQARVAQDQAKKEEKEQRHDENEGFEIYQLETKKIDISTDSD